jgi:hypothetical protein
MADDMILDLSSYPHVIMVRIHVPKVSNLLTLVLRGNVPIFYTSSKHPNWKDCIGYGVENIS